MHYHIYPSLPTTIDRHTQNTEPPLRTLYPHHNHGNLNPMWKPIPPRQPATSYHTIMSTHPNPLQLPQWIILYSSSIDSGNRVVIEPFYVLICGPHLAKSTPLETVVQDMDQDKTDYRNEVVLNGSSRYSDELVLGLGGTAGVSTKVEEGPPLGPLPRSVTVVRKGSAGRMANGQLDQRMNPYGDLYPWQRQYQNSSDEILQGGASVPAILLVPPKHGIGAGRSLTLGISPNFGWPTGLELGLGEGGAERGSGVLTSHQQRHLQSWFNNINAHADTYSYDPRLSSHPPRQVLDISHTQVPHLANIYASNQPQYKHDRKFPTHNSNARNRGCTGSGLHRAVFGDLNIVDSGSTRSKRRGVVMGTHRLEAENVLGQQVPAPVQGEVVEVDGEGRHVGGGDEYEDSDGEGNEVGEIGADGDADEDGNGELDRPAEDWQTVYLLTPPGTPNTPNTPNTP